MGQREVVTRAIVNTTKDLIREKLIEQITVTEICKKSGVNYRTFYRYFKDKHDIVEWIFAHESLTNGLNKEGLSFWDHFPYIAQTLYNDREFYSHAFQFHGQNSFREYSISQLYPILEADYGNAFPDRQSLDFYIDHVCNMAFDSFVLWLSADPCLLPEQFISFFQNCFTAVSDINLQLIGRK